MDNPPPVALDENNSFTVNGTTFAEIPFTIDGFNMDPSVVVLTNVNVDTLIYKDNIVNESFIAKSFPAFTSLEHGLRSLLLVHLKTLSEYQATLFIALLR